MRRGVAFAILTVPVVVWASISIWAQAQASGWTPAAGELSLPVRAALASNQSIIRVLPFAAIPVALTWPLIVAGIAAITGTASSRNAATRADVVGWWSVSGIAFVAVFLTGGIFYVFEPATGIPAALLGALAWIGTVAFWLSLAAAYAVQQKRYLANKSSWNPRSLLAGVAALNCVGLFALPVLALIAFRRDDATNARAVERADATDEVRAGNENHGLHR